MPPDGPGGLGEPAAESYELYTPHSFCPAAAVSVNRRILLPRKSNFLSIISWPYGTIIDDGLLNRIG
jgi:hypothetical protein